MSVGTPSTIVNPVGVFIQAFTLRMKNVPAAPASITGTSAARCARGGSRSQPYR